MPEGKVAPWDEPAHYDRRRLVGLFEGQVAKAARRERPGGWWDCHPWAPWARVCRGCGGFLLREWPWSKGAWHCSTCNERTRALRTADPKTGSTTLGWEGVAVKAARWPFSDAGIERANLHRLRGIATRDRADLGACGERLRGEAGPDGPEGSCEVGGVDHPDGAQLPDGDEGDREPARPLRDEDQGGGDPPGRGGGEPVAGAGGVAGEGGALEGGGGGWGGESSTRHGPGCPGA